MRVTSASVPDIGRSLRLAREQARLPLDEAAARANLTPEDAELLESGAVERMRDRVETLRSLRAYADSLGLPGNDYALAVIDLWPTVDQLPASLRDSGQVPVVSVTTAPAGGHTPADGAGWPLDHTGAADFSVTGVVSPLGLPASDALPFTGVDTGQIPAIRQYPPRALKVLVGLAAVLVALGIFTLTEHSNFGPWHKDLQSDASRWAHDLKVAAGLSPKTRATTHHTKVPVQNAPPKVAMVHNSTSSITINVSAPTFTVKMVAFGYASWMEVTEPTQQAPVFEQVLQGGASQTFTVGHSLTVETGSAAARAYMYVGTTFVGYYFPSEAPYTMTFNAVS
jgi:cytoskeletal protein RodZ